MTTSMTEHATANMSVTEKTCIEAQDLKIHFKLKSGLFSKPRYLKAVDGVSFSITQGKTMGLVGESGAGRAPSDAHSSACMIRQVERFSLTERTSPIQAMLRCSLTAKRCR